MGACQRQRESCDGSGREKPSRTEEQDEHGSVVWCSGNHRNGCKVLIIQGTGIPVNLGVVGEATLVSVC